MRRVLVLALLAACATDENALIGSVEKVEMPSTARIGQPVTVTVTTTGGGCLRPVSTSVVTTPEQIVITPYDEYPEGAACTRELARVVHTAVVTFEKAGPTEVHVRTLVGDHIDDIERRIVVEY